MSENNCVSLILNPMTDKTWMTRSQFAKCDKFEIELWILRQTYACG